MLDEDADLRALLSILEPKARHDLRRVLIRDQPDRDAIATKPLHCGDEAGADWADIIDTLTDASERAAPRCQAAGRA